MGLMASSTDSEYWAHVLTIVPILGAVVATLVYFIRLYSRWLGTAGFAVDDALMGIGVLLSYGATVFVVYTAFNGVGKPTKSLPSHEATNLRFGSWMIQKFWAPCLAFIKISILMFLRRILEPVALFQRLSLALIIFIVLWAVTALMGNIFQCWPITHYYKPFEPGHCMPHQDRFFETMGSVSLITDVSILALPMPWIWRLQTNLRKKLAIVSVFAMGGLVCIFSLLRLVQFRYFLTTDLASSSALESVWTILEIDLAIICGCLPLLTPLFLVCFQRVRTVAATSASSQSPSDSRSATRLYVRSRSKSGPLRSSRADFRKLGGESSQTLPHPQNKKAITPTTPSPLTTTTTTTTTTGEEPLDGSRNHVDDASIELHGIQVENGRPFIEP